MAPSTIKEDILAAVPIDSYIGRYVSLKKAGRGSYKGLCPFHNEKTPSFHVHPERGFYHCFGCGRGGDLFRFVMDMENVGFREALKILADFAGIDWQPQGKDKRAPLFEINEKAKDFFRGFLSSPAGQPFRDYLFGRGISKEAVAHFQIGAAPDAWDFLLRSFLLSQSEEQNSSPEQKKLRSQLLHLGLLRRSEKDKKRLYDFFRNRVCFPIRELSGRIAGFGGRALENKSKSQNAHEPAKYINSPDSSVFHKSRILYGLYEALPAIRKERFIYITEGYLDVIGLWMAGIQNACAPLGTALTGEHLKLLQRYADRVCALFDGDAAGRKAALRFSEMLFSQSDLHGEVLLMPAGADAFDLCRKLSRISLTDYLQNAVSAERYYLLETLFPKNLNGHLANASDQNWNEKARFAAAYYKGEHPELYPAGYEARRTALDRLYDALSHFSTGIGRGLLLEEAARILALNPLELRQEYEKRKGKITASGPQKKEPTHSFVRQHSRQTEPKNSPSPPADPVLVAQERELMLEVLFEPSLLGLYLDRFRELAFADFSSELLFRYLESRFLLGQTWNIQQLAHLDLPAAVIQNFLEAAARRLELPSKESRIAEQKERLEDLFLHHRIRLLKKSMAELEARQYVADSVERSAIMEKRKELLSTLRTLEEKRRT